MTNKHRTALMLTAVEHDRACAMQQHNLFPWLGNFDKIRQADVFVFFDDVEFPRSGSGMGFWTNRARISVQGWPYWIGAPASRRHGRGRTTDLRISPNSQWRRKLMQTLETYVHYTIDAMDNRWQPRKPDRRRRHDTQLRSPREVGYVVRQL